MCVQCFDIKMRNRPTHSVVLHGLLSTVEVSKGSHSIGDKKIEVSESILSNKAEIVSRKVYPILFVLHMCVFELVGFGWIF